MIDKAQEWKNTTWQICPVLDVPGLEPEAVQFAVLGSDPIEDYRKSLMQVRDRFQKEVDEEKDSTLRERLKKVQMSSRWDFLFKVVTGDQVYLLGASRRPTKKSVTQRTCVISSNELGGRKWLTTKVVYHEDAPICWCIPVETAIGTSAEVHLRHENAFNMQKVYGEFIRNN